MSLEDRTKSAPLMEPQMEAPIETKADKKPASKPGRTTTHTFLYKDLTREYLYVEGNLPFGLVVLLHPFNGTPETTLERYRELALKGFSILAPRGIEKSWNAGACCGKAVVFGLDDIGFIRAVTLHVLQERFSERPGMKAYLTGYSNGAFLASKVALSMLAHGEAWIKALAMNAGYAYDTHLYLSVVENGRVSSENAFPVLALHGLNDTSVRISGCCAGPGGDGQCCCNIYMPKCVSFQDTFESWEKIYQCNTTKPPTLQKMNVPGVPEMSKRFGSVCYAANECLAPLQFCALPDVPHRLDESIPAGSIVSEFFYNDYSKMHLEDTVATKSAESSGRPRNPHAAPPGTIHQPSTGGYVILFAFVLAFFYMLARTFTRKPLQAILPSRPTEGTLRERQALTQPGVV